MNKIIGIILSILSLALALFGALALVKTSEMAQMLSHAINEFNITKL